MRYVQGYSREQITLLPPSPDEYVTEDNPDRVIDAFVSKRSLGD